MLYKYVLSSTFTNNRCRGTFDYLDSRLINKRFIFYKPKNLKLHKVEIKLTMCLTRDVKIGIQKISVPRRM